MENNKPTYEELMSAYQQLLSQFEQLKIQLIQYKNDRINDQLQILLDVIKNKSAYTNEIIDLANWHIINMLKKPEND